MAAALQPLCAERVRYALKAVRRAAERRSEIMLAAVPQCLRYFPKVGQLIAQEMLGSKHPVVVKAGLRSFAALGKSDPMLLGAVSVKAISGFVSAKDLGVRAVAARSLARIGTSDAAQELLKIAMGHERAASKSAIAALAGMDPLPVSALREVLTRGPAFDAAPMIERLIRRKTDAARELLLHAISLASYMTWWDTAVAGFVGHGKPAFEIAAEWMYKHPRRTHNLVTAFMSYADKAAPHFKGLARKLPARAVYDNLRIGVVRIVAKGQPTGWVGVLHAIAMNDKLSYRARVAALQGLARAERQNSKALAAAHKAMKSDDDTIADAGRRTAALLGDQAAADAAITMLRKTPSTSWRVAWVETLSAFPGIDADYLLVSRFPGASDAVQSRILDVLIEGRRIGGVAHVMQVAITNNHPLRLKALTLLGYER